MVRMGELAASAAPGEILVSIGLGSCVGLALVDARRSVAGLAHVMLPHSTAPHGPEAKFADLAVGRLLERVTGLGAVRPEAVLVGGAQMFALNGTANIGSRNEAAVRAELERLRIPVRATATGGDKGRTVRVHVDGARVTVREVAGTEEHLYGRPT
jgi:chemotaxis protein CheD